MNENARQPAAKARLAGGVLTSLPSDVTIDDVFEVFLTAGLGLRLDLLLDDALGDVFQLAFS